jgi:hypothetical protein
MRLLNPQSFMPDQPDFPDNQQPLIASPVFPEKPAKDIPPDSGKTP